MAALTMADVARRQELARIVEEWSRGVGRVQTYEELQTLFAAIVDYGRHLDSPATSLATANGELERARERLARLTGKR